MERVSLLYLTAEYASILRHSSCKKKKSETLLKSELCLTKVCTVARDVPVTFRTRTHIFRDSYDLF